MKDSGRYFWTWVLALGLALAMVLGQAYKSSAEEKRMLIDDFETGKIINRAEGKSNVYFHPPSRVMVTTGNDTINGKPTKVLTIKYDKKNAGGPDGYGGWCGYYTILKCAYPGVCLLQGTTPVEKDEIVYLNASNYKSLTFWVKGDKGGESFKVGLADAHWDQIGDTVKSEAIGKYIPEGKLTTNWQKATIPLAEFFLDIDKLASVSIGFESECFPTGCGQGTVYIDDIAFEAD